jgi:formate/nitrite transporter FocA (FNT family)
MANAAQDLTGKAVGIWLCISAFPMFGWEHSIANQFLLPMAFALGEGELHHRLLSARQVWGNLVPSTLGNWVGGAGVATVCALIYGSAGRRVQKAWDGLEARVVRGVAAGWGRVVGRRGSGAVA